MECLCANKRLCSGLVGRVFNDLFDLAGFVIYGHGHRIGPGAADIVVRHAAADVFDHFVERAHNIARFIFGLGAGIIGVDVYLRAPRIGILMDDAGRRFHIATINRVFFIVRVFSNDR